MKIYSDPAPSTGANEVSKLTSGMKGGILPNEHDFVTGSNLNALIIFFVGAAVLGSGMMSLFHSIIAFVRAAHSTRASRGPTFSKSQEFNLFT